MRFPAMFLRALVVSGLATAALQATAAPRLNLSAGVSYMDGYDTPAAFADAILDAHRIGSSRFSWSPAFSFGWIDGRDLEQFRGRYTTRDSIWLIAAGARFQYGDADDWYRALFLSFQPALHSGRTVALSSVYEWVTTLGWQGRRFNVQIRHISNGGLHEPNRGETMALVGIGFDL